MCRGCWKIGTDVVCRGLRTGRTLFQDDPKLGGQEDFHAAAAAHHATGRLQLGFTDPEGGLAKGALGEEL